MGITETLRILLTIFLSTACIQNVRLFGFHDLQYRTRRSSPLMRAFACIGLWCARIAYARIRSVANAS